MTTRRSTRSSTAASTKAAERPKRTRGKPKKEAPPKTKKSEPKPENNKLSVPLRSRKKTETEEGSTRTRVRKPVRIVRKPVTEEKKKELKERLKRKRKAHEAQLEKLDKKPKKPKIQEIEYNWAGWKDIYLVGTEWHMYDEVFEYDWDFDHLEDMLLEGDFGTGKNVYLFGATEPQLVRLHKDSPEQKMVPIPVIVAVVSSMPPPSQLGVNSVQMVNEEIVPMSSMKMSWVPFERRHGSKKNKSEEGIPTEIYYLHCSRRRSALKRMKPEEVKKYEYCMPYLMKLEVDDFDTDTVVNIVESIGGRGLSFEFDWEMDELDEKVEELAKAEDLNKKQQTEIRDVIRREVRAAKKAKKEARQAQQDKIDALSHAEREAIKSMKLIKFYPQNEEPLIAGQISKYINRYYGSAHQVYPKRDTSERPTLGK